MARKTTTVRPSGSGPESFYPTALRRGPTRGEDGDRADGRPAQVLVDAAELEHLRARAALATALTRQQAETAHELRTPLVSVLGYGRRLDQAGPLNDEQRVALQTIVAAGQHLLDLLDGVVAVGSSAPGVDDVTLRPVDVAATVQHALALVRPQAEAAGIRIDVEPHQDPARPAAAAVVLADRPRLVQVLVNLLTNAVKYNQPGGRVTVRWHPSERSLGEPATVTPRLHLSVADTGIGIDPALQARLFTPFDRLGAEHTSVEGHGIGLALCRDLLESMRGTIVADSLPGIGSTFTIELPRPPHRPAAAAAGSPPAGVPQAARTLRVLNVEDNRANRELVDEVLLATGDLAVTSTGSGLAAIDLARTERPDVILLDAHLPDVSVDQVLHVLQADATTATIPVLILTADTSTALAQHLRRLGAAQCLTKPIDLDALIATVRRAARPRRRAAAVVATFAPERELARSRR